MRAEIVNVKMLTTSTGHETVVIKLCCKSMRQTVGYDFLFLSKTGER